MTVPEMQWYLDSAVRAARDPSAVTKEMSRAAKRVIDYFELHVPDDVVFDIDRGAIGPTIRVASKDRCLAWVALLAKESSHTRAVFLAPE